MIINEKTLVGLRRLGLTNKEAEALYTVAKKGQAPASEVSKGIGVHYPLVYRLLTSLETKGWLEASQDRPKLYRVRDVEEVVREAVEEEIKTVNKAAEKVIADLSVVEEVEAEKAGTWIIRGWGNTIKKARELAKKASKSIYIVGREILGEEELEEIIRALLVSKGYINAYLTSTSRLPEMRRKYKEVNYQLTLSGFKPDPTRFITLFIIFDEFHALFINAYYREGRFEKGKVYATWERDPELIEILMVGNNLRLMEWSWA